MTIKISSTPMVSIIMPCYNNAQHIEQSIRSVEEQTYEQWELLVVDDGSSDDSVAIIQRFATNDKRIHLTTLHQNSGAAIARNTALREAQGKLIAFLDADDIWLPEKLEKQVAFMEANDYAFTYHDYTEIDEDSKPLGIYVSGKKHVGKWGMMSCCWPGCLSVMYDARKVGLIQIPDIKKNNDTAIWLQVIEKVDCYLLPENLASYRQRKGSITPTSIWEKIGWHYILFRKGAKMSPISSAFWMCINIIACDLPHVYHKMGNIYALTRQEQGKDRYILCDFPNTLLPNKITNHQNTTFLTKYNGIY